MLTPIMRPILQPVLVPVDYEYGDVFNPLSLFAGGKKGYWHDFMDRSTLFQDTAGTIPALAVGDPVALVLDKSGNGNHLVQSISTRRPLVSADGLYFDGIDDCFVTIGVVQAEGQSVLTLYGGEWQNAETSNFVVESSQLSNTTTGAFYLVKNSGGSGKNSTRVSGTSSANYEWLPAESPSKTVAGLRGRTTSGNALNQCWKNGEVIGTSTSSLGSTVDFSSTTHYIGARNQSQYFYKGTMTYLMTIFKECTDTEVKTMSRYINNRMGGVY